MDIDAQQVMLKTYIFKMYHLTTMLHQSEQMIRNCIHSLPNTIATHAVNIPIRVYSPHSNI